MVSSYINYFDAHKNTHIAQLLSTSRGYYKEDCACATSPVGVVVPLFHHSIPPFHSTIPFHGSIPPNKDTRSRAYIIACLSIFLRLYSIAISGGRINESKFLFSVPISFYLYAFLVLFVKFTTTVFSACAQLGNHVT